MECCLGAEELKDFHGFYLIRGFIGFTIEFTIASLHYVQLWQWISANTFNRSAKGFALRISLYDRIEFTLDESLT